MAITVTTNSNIIVLDTEIVIQGDVEGDPLDYVPLTDILLKNKWKLYQANRQMISGEYINSAPVRPCQPFIDSKQSNLPFILMGYIFKPMEDVTTIDFYEYDATNVPNLVISEITITQ